MILSEAKKQIAMIIDAYSERGEVKTSSDTDVTDFYLKMNSYLDMAQKFIAETKFIRKVFKLSHIMPFTPEEWQFELYTHTDTDIIFSVPVAYAYSFKVDGSAMVYIEGVNQDDTTTELDSIYAYSDDGFTLFKNSISIPTESDFKAIQIRFSGDEYYNIKDIALFNAKYSHYTKIPDFGRYIEYQMPSDFFKILAVQIRRESDWGKLYEFGWESPTVLAVSIYEQGEIRIEYAGSPTTIDDSTSEDYEFEIMTAAQSAMIFYAAALLVQKENFAQHQLLMQQFNIKMTNISNGTKIHQTRVKRTYV